MTLCIIGSRLRLAWYDSQGSDREIAKTNYKAHLDRCPFCREYLVEGYEIAKTAVHPPLREESEA